MEGLAVVDGNLASSQLDLCHQQNLYLNIQVHYNVWCTNCLIYKTTCRTIIHTELDRSALWQELEIRELKMSTHEMWLFMTCHLCAHLDVPLKSLKSVWPREGLVDVQPAIVALEEVDSRNLLHCKTCIFLTMHCETCIFHSAASQSLHFANTTAHKTCIMITPHGNTCIFILYHHY